MPRQVMTWEELLSFETFDDYSDEYGPNTQAVVNCFATLDTVSWFSHVGAAKPDQDAHRVDTWTDAIAPLMDQSRAGFTETGLLKEPAAIIDEMRGKKGFKKWQNAAIKKSQDYRDYGPYIPSYFEKGEHDFMLDHLASYIEGLMVEIICADEIECTFFRQHLPWFEAGHFPCGWVGEWPDGVIRVF